MEPQAIAEQPLPETPHITTPLPGPLAANCSCAPGFICGELGVTVSCEEKATSVAVEPAVRLGAAADLAVIVILGGVGRLAGAAYRPEAEIDPHVDPLQPVPATLHLTAVLVVPLTVAE